MTLKEAIEKIKLLSQSLNKQGYLSHYTIELELNKIQLPASSAEDKILLSEYQKLRIDLENKLSQLKNSNRVMLQTLDFVATCIELINKNDTNNLVDLILIGEYFGTGPDRTDVTSALLEVYEHFRTQPELRKASNKQALDELCTRLNEPRLSPPNLNFDLFAAPIQKVKAILNANAINSLMVWLVNAKQDDRNFALRAAASVDTCSHCLMFLLLRTEPNTEAAPIDLLAPGQPSGQIALHRAISSGKTVIVSLLLDEKFNPSNDLLKQLLVRDKKGFSPIDLIEKISDDIDQSCMITRIQAALNKYRNDPRLKLPEEDFELIEKNLETVRNKLNVYTGRGPGYR